jgi:hypothetical protein
MRSMLRPRFYEPLDALCFGFEILGGAQPQISNRGVSGALRELAIPRRKLAQFLRILHGGLRFVTSRRLNSAVRR